MDILTRSSYFVFNGLLSLYKSHVEKDTVFVGIRADPLNPKNTKSIQVDATTDRKSADYRITVMRTVNGKTSTSKSAAHIGRFFDVEGTFLVQPFVSFVSGAFKQE